MWGIVVFVLLNHELVVHQPLTDYLIQKERYWSEKDCREAIERFMPDVEVRIRMDKNTTDYFLKCSPLSH